MKFPLRIICSECGRSITWSDDEIVGAASPCPICGGRVGLTGDDADFALATTETPASLRLTPDEIGAEIWAREADRGALTEVGRFQIRELIGNGGFGHVYRAFDSRLEREVALKVLRDSHPPARVIERFFREARAAAQLDHANIVSLFDAGRDEGKCWIAYQYVDGPTLGRYRERQTCDHRMAAAIVRDLADALAHAHDRGVYHRDLKPANVLMDSKGRPRLTDFGLARRIDFEPTMTREGAILGTANYMSPEQASGKSHQADGRSDLYSLGIIFYEILCGRRPVDLPSNAPSWKSTSERTRVLSPRSRDRSIPRALERICLRALATNPDDRYLNARLMADDLDRWLNIGSGGSTRAFLVAGVLLAALLTREGTAIVAHQWSSSANSASTPLQALDEEKPPSLDAPLKAHSPIRKSHELELFASNHSNHYHQSTGCPSARLILDDNKVWFVSREEAESKGLSLCSKCDQKKSRQGSGP